MATTVKYETNKPKVAYFTFDADMTPLMKIKLNQKKVSFWYSKELVNYLESEKIPATIFVSGMFAEIYPNLIKELAKIPEIKIGNHTYDHPGFESPCFKLKIIKTDKEKNEEIEKTQKILTPLIGYAPKLFRYPGLCHNKQDDKLTEGLGLTISNSGLISGDSFNKNPKNITKKVLDNIHDGSVVIMHLGGPNATSTYLAFKEIVNKLKEEGFTFKSL